MYGDDPAYLRFRHLILNILDLQVGSESLAIVPEWKIVSTSSSSPFVR